MRAAGRSPEKLAANLGMLPGLEVVSCDVLRREQIERAVQGAACVVYAASASRWAEAEAVDAQGAALAAEAAAEAKVRHFVLVSSLLVSERHRFVPIRLFLNNIMARGLMDAKASAEASVRALAPRLPYTVVRPGGMGGPVPPPPAGEAPALYRLEVGQGDHLRGRLSRDDAAACVAAVVRAPEAVRNVTFEVVRRTPAELASDQHHTELFEGLEPD